MDVLDADFSGTYIAALCPHICHPGQSEFSQVTVLDARGHEWHGDVSVIGGCYICSHV